MNVSVVVQHHPARADVIERLRARVGGADIVADSDPVNGSPLRTYLDCLRRTPEGASHRLVIQDDTEVVDGFREKAEAVIGAHQDILVALFVPGAPPHRAAVLRAQVAGEDWVTLPPTWIPTVALSWPAALAAEFVLWAEATYPDYGTKRHGDDFPVGQWANRHHLRAGGPVPSLVQHPDITPSLIGRKAQAGANRSRVAAAYLG